MQKELQRPSPNRPQELLQDLLGNKEHLRQILTGENNKPFLEGEKRKIDNFGPQEKVIFLEQTFAILSDPNPRSQDKRDVALDLLRIIDLKSINPEKLKKSYLKAASNLKKNLNIDSDPWGEIHALLTAGKIIVPSIEDSRGITLTWKQIAIAFTGTDRQKILDDIKEIRQLMPSKFPELDSNVKILLKEGLRDQDIATQLGVKILDIHRSTSRLRNKGIRLGSFNRKKGKRQTEQQKQLFEAVKNLRNKGMGNLEIASVLGTPQEKIKSITRELILKGEIPPIYKPRKKV